MPSLFQQEILKLQSVQIVFNTRNASRRSSSDLAISVRSFANKTLSTVLWFIRKWYIYMFCHCSVILFMYWLAGKCRSFDCLMSPMANSNGQEMSSLLWNMRLYYLDYKTSIYWASWIDVTPSNHRLFKVIPSIRRSPKPSPHSSDLQNKILKEFLNHVPSRSVTFVSAHRTSYEFKLLRSTLHNFLELTDDFSRLKCKHYPQHSAAVGKTSAATLVKGRPIVLADCALATHSIYLLLIWRRLQ
jgi:hypothetical protein